MNARMWPRAVRAAVVVSGALLAARARPLAAQGSLGGQGFGYPPGQLSTRALGTGGGLAEFDPVSPINDAQLALYGRLTASFQYDPEFRTTSVGGATAHNTIARFPVLAIGIPLRRRFTLGVSASTLLDRSFTTQYPSTTIVGGDSVRANETVEARGSIADLRFGGAMYVAPWLRVGAAVHALTGRNRVVSGRTFVDTTEFGSVSDSSTLSFAGSAFSAGVDVTPVRGLSVAGSARVGGRMRVEVGDSVLGRGNAPDRFGVGLRVDRIPGTTLAASYARTNWSSMRGLGTSLLDARDGYELMGGVEAGGPSVGAAPSVLRLGARRRTLPFAIGGARILETAYTGGFGLPFGGGRALADLAVQRANRTPDGGTTAVDAAREHAWTVSIGFTVRP